jgi:hypothetical protein
MSNGATTLETSVLKIELEEEPGLGTYVDLLFRLIVEREEEEQFLGAAEVRVKLDDADCLLSELKAKAIERGGDLLSQIVSHLKSSPASS